MFKINDSTKCVIAKDGSCVYDFVNDEKDVDFILKNAENRRMESVNYWKKYIEAYPESKEYKDSYERYANIEYVVSTYGEFEKLNRKYWLSKPLVEIDEDRFNNMLECLPPLKWVTRGKVQEFLMSEMMSGVYTQQYAEKEGKYYEKIVDATDESTWIHNFI